MKYIEKLIQYFSYGDYKQEFLEYKVIQNNIRILILSGFLAVEQAFYGFFIREPGTIIQKIHYFSAFVMLAYFFIGLYLRSKKNKMLHQVFALSIVIFGILIAVYRSFVVENTPSLSFERCSERFFEIYR
ncbi:MAG: hypothetical protein MJA31_05850, partial [Clostridia bacterium]|nr:hypothetical protein [Clostridia bacterium]